MPCKQRHAWFVLALRRAAVLTEADAKERAEIAAAQAKAEADERAENGAEWAANQAGDVANTGRQSGDGVTAVMQAAVEEVAEGADTGCRAGTSKSIPTGHKPV